MKISYILIFIILAVFVQPLAAQQIAGKLVDENDQGLPQVNVSIYLGQNEYQAQTDSAGNFTFDGITNVIEDLLPAGYSVSDNYPNPFNPKTRLNITMPNAGKVKVLIYNLLGQQVADKLENQFGAGTHYIDLELNGLSNGIYIARITIDEKYSVSKKMMLIYGSQHLNTGEPSTVINDRNIFPKNNFTDLPIDSLVAFNDIIGRKLFNSLPQYNGQFLDLGDLLITRYCPETPTVEFGGRIYNTVQIGDQCWLKENLNIGVMISGNSEMINNGAIEKYCYGNDTLNCDTYGGLYQWSEAMKYSIQEGVKGICPDGWHIPTKAELEILQLTLNSDGNALKSIGEGSGSGAGSNASGFSALLSGGRGFLGSFGGITERANFWSSTEQDPSNAHNLYVSSTSSNILFIGNTKKSGLSVRCIQGEGTEILNTPPFEPNNPDPQSGSGEVSKFTGLNWTGGDPDNDQLLYDLYFGTTAAPQLLIAGLDSTYYDPGFLLQNTTYFWKVISKDGQDSTSGPLWSFTTAGETLAGEPCPEIPTIIYDGKIYNTVKIGDQCWMRENIDIGMLLPGSDNMTDNNVIEKYCYNDNPDSCNVYGGLYQWNEAMQYSTLTGSQGICPDGWHIPSVSEFDSLSAAVGNDGNTLKAIGEGSGSGTGNNASGFTALLAGDRRLDGSFLDLHDFTNFWSSEEASSNNANYIYLSKTNSQIGRFNFNKNYGFSVRCIKN